MKTLYVCEYDNGDNIQSLWFVGEDTQSLRSHEEREQACKAMSKELDITLKEARKWLINVYPVSKDLIREVFNSYRGKK
jgi:hypothetical protein